MVLYKLQRENLNKRRLILFGKLIFTDEAKLGELLIPIIEMVVIGKAKNIKIDLHLS